MFKDDYKLVNEKVTASYDLKRRTLEKINKSNEFNYKPFLRYGLVCASFLFLVTVYPTLSSNQSFSNDKNTPVSVNGQIGEAPPQTGVEEYYVSSIAEKSKVSSKLEKKPQISSKQVTSSNVQSSPPKANVSEPPAIKDIPINEVLPEALPQEESKDTPIKAENSKKADLNLFAIASPLDKIKFNELKEYVALQKLKNFTTEDGYKKEQWNDKQIIDYLGISPVPTFIPPDLATGLPKNEVSANQTVVFNKDNVIAYDTFHYSYLKPQETKEVDPSRRALSIAVAKDKYPCDCELYMKKEESEISLINGCEMSLGYTKQAYKFDENKEPIAYFERYVGEFIYNNVGYRVIADNLTEKEFIDVIKSIVIPDFKPTVEQPKQPDKNEQTQDNQTKETSSATQNTDKEVANESVSSTQSKEQIKK